MSDRDKKLLGVLGVIGVLVIGIFVVRGMGDSDNPAPTTASPPPTQAVAESAETGGSDAPAESRSRRSRRSPRKMDSGDDQDRLEDEPIVSNEDEDEPENRTARRPKRPKRRSRANAGEDEEEGQQEKKKEAYKPKPMGAVEL